MSSPVLSLPSSGKCLVLCIHSNLERVLCKTTCHLFFFFAPFVDPQVKFPIMMNFYFRIYSKVNSSSSHCQRNLKQNKVRWLVFRGAAELWLLSNLCSFGVVSSVSGSTCLSAVSLRTHAALKQQRTSQLV